MRQRAIRRPRGSPACPRPGPRTRRGAGRDRRRAAWSGGSLDVAWVGDVRVVLVRGGRSVATTAEHSMARELGLPDHDLARITSRSLGLHPPERARWDTRPGDVLLLCAPHLHDFRPEAAWLADALDPRTSLRNLLGDLDEAGRALLGVSQLRLPAGQGPSTPR